MFTEQLYKDMKEMRAFRPYLEFAKMINIELQEKINEMMACDDPNKIRCLQGQCRSLQYVLSLPEFLIQEYEAMAQQPADGENQPVPPTE